MASDDDPMMRSPSGRPLRTAVRLRMSSSSLSTGAGMTSVKESFSPDPLIYQNPHRSLRRRDAPCAVTHSSRRDRTANIGRGGGASQDDDPGEESSSEDNDSDVFGDDGVEEEEDVKGRKRTRATPSSYRASRPAKRRKSMRLSGRDVANRRRSARLTSVDPNPEWTGASGRRSGPSFTASAAAPDTGRPVRQLRATTLAKSKTLYRQLQSDHPSDTDEENQHVEEEMHGEELSQRMRPGGAKRRSAAATAHLKQIRGKDWDDNEHQPVDGAVADNDNDAVLQAEESGSGSDDEVESSNDDDVIKESELATESTGDDDEETEEEEEAPVLRRSMRSRKIIMSDDGAEPVNKARKPTPDVSSTSNWFDAATTSGIVTRSRAARTRSGDHDADDEDDENKTVNGGRRYPQRQNRRPPTIFLPEQQHPQPQRRARRANGRRRRRSDGSDGGFSSDGSSTDAGDEAAQHRRRAQKNRPSDDALCRPINMTAAEVEEAKRFTKYGGAEEGIVNCEKVTFDHVGGLEESKLPFPPCGLHIVLTSALRHSSAQGDDLDASQLSRVF